MAMTTWKLKPAGGGSSKPLVSVINGDLEHINNSGVAGGKSHNQNYNNADGLNINTVTCNELENLMESTRSFTGEREGNWLALSDKRADDDFANFSIGKFSFLEPNAKVFDTESKNKHIADSYNSIDPLKKFPLLANISTLNCSQLRALDTQLKNEVVSIEAGYKQKKVIDSAIDAYKRKINDFIGQVEALLQLNQCDLELQQQESNLDSANKLALYNQIMASGNTDGGGGMSGAQISLIVAGILGTTLVIVLFGGKKSAAPQSVPA